MHREKDPIYCFPLCSMADEKEESRKVLEETYAELSEEDRAFLKARIGIEDEAKLKEHILQVQVDAWTVSVVPSS